MNINFTLNETDDSGNMIASFDFEAKISGDTFTLINNGKTIANIKVHSMIDSFSKDRIFMLEIESGNDSYEFTTTPQKFWITPK